MDGYNHARNRKWFPYNKGGDARCWYGNRELVVNFENNGAEIRETAQQGISIRITSIEKYFNEGVTWTALTSSRNTFRYSPAGAIFDSNKGPMFFDEGHGLLLYFLGIYNSCVAKYILNVMNPSLSLQNGDVENFPTLVFNKDNVIKLVATCIELSRIDYDSFEASWDFKRHPLV